ncbi:MAG TPA: hypothetical protein VFV43_05445 [Limnobacter sp.]|nr:hypothetical protein [Limnobacter sp.]
MSNSIQSVQPNLVLQHMNQLQEARQSLEAIGAHIPTSIHRVVTGLARHQDLISLVPELPQSDHLHEISITLTESLAEYRRMGQACEQLSFDADRLLGQLRAAIPSPAINRGLHDILRGESQIFDRLNQEDDVCQHLLISLDHQTHELINQHLARVE